MTERQNDTYSLVGSRTRLRTEGQSRRRGNENVKTKPSYVPVSIELNENSVRRSFPSSRGWQRQRSRDPLAKYGLFNPRIKDCKGVFRSNGHQCVCRALSITKMLKFIIHLYKFPYYSAAKWITTPVAAKGRGGQTVFKEPYSVIRSN